MMTDTRPAYAQTTARIASGHTDRTLFYALLGILIWAPLPLGSNRLWAVSLLEALVLLLAGAWLIRFSLGQVQLSRVFTKAWPLLLLMGLNCLWQLMQILPLQTEFIGYFSPGAASTYSQVASADASWITLSLDPVITRLSLIESLALWLMLALCLLLTTSRRRLRMLALTIVLSGVFQATYGGLMTLSGTEYGFFTAKSSYTGYATGTFINRNHLAGYLIMCLAVGIGLLLGSLHDSQAHSWREHSRRLLQTLLGPKARLRIYLAVMVIALVLTRSRMGNTAFFASLSIAGVIALLLSRHATRATLILLGSLIIIDLFIVGTFFGVDKVVDRLQNTSTTTETRDEVVRDSLTLWGEYWTTGTGSGSYYGVFPQYRQGDVTSFYDHAHNDYLQFGSEQGVIGIGLLGASVLLSFVTGLYSHYRRRDLLMRGLSFSSLMAIIALLLHSTVDFNLQIPANAQLFVILLGLPWICLHLDRKKRTGG